MTRRPNTKEYSANARESLGMAVTRAREALGHQWRPGFAHLAGISVRSLVNLEQGAPVGPTIYEAVARVIPVWSITTPQRILEGHPAPDNIPARTPLYDATDQEIIDADREQLLKLRRQVAKFLGAEDADRWLINAMALRERARTEQTDTRDAG